MIIIDDGYKKIKQVEKGDKITAKIDYRDHTYEIDKILYQDYALKDDFGNPDYWDIEFLDPNGNYHHYKSQFDKGYITPIREEIRQQ